MQPSVNVSRHPLVLHKLTMLRDRATESRNFRALIRELTALLVYEALQDLKAEPYTVSTPLAECQGFRIAEHIAVIPILRAALGMVDAILDVLPTARVWHLGMERDHHTLQPITVRKALSVSFMLQLHASAASRAQSSSCSVSNGWFRCRAPGVPRY